MRALARSERRPRRSVPGVAGVVDGGMVCVSTVMGEGAHHSTRGRVRSPESLSSPPGQMEGFRILGAELVAPERRLARVEITTRRGSVAVTELKRVSLIFVNGEWKWFVKNPENICKALTIPFWIKSNPFCADFMHESVCINQFFAYSPPVLIEFKVANFRSFREEQKFSLVAANWDKDLISCTIDKKLPGLSGVRFLKGAAIYGANASGKSNVIEAFSFITNFVQRSFTKIQPGDPTGTKPFKLDLDSVRKPSVFEITFLAVGVRYVFGFSVTPERVTEEYLIAYPKGVPQRWYHRKFNPKKNEYEWAKSSSEFKTDKSLQNKTRENSLFLSVGPQFNHSQLTQVFSWFKSNIKFIHLSADAMLHPGFTAELLSDQAHHDRIITILKNADFGVSDAKVRENEITVEELKQNVPPRLLAQLEKMGPMKPAKNVEISLTHTAEGQEPVAFDFEEEESAGTRRFFSLIGPWMDILDKGYTVFVDEIETSLHPILVKELLKLLLCSKNNRNGAQVIFTTHNPILLDGTLMRRDQIWFTEKSPAGATHLYPLTDYNPRKEEAVARGYLAGRYGGVPFIPQGLCL